MPAWILFITPRVPVLALTLPIPEWEKSLWGVWELGHGFGEGAWAIPHCYTGIQEVSLENSDLTPLPTPGVSSQGFHCAAVKNGVNDEWGAIIPYRRWSKYPPELPSASGSPVTTGGPSLWNALGISLNYINIWWHIGCSTKFCWGPDVVSMA